MKKTETLRQLAASANEKSIVAPGGGGANRSAALSEDRERGSTGVDAGADRAGDVSTALTDEIRITLDEIGPKSRAHSERFEKEVASAAVAVLQAAAMANESADRMSWAGQGMELRHYVLVVTTGLLTAALVSAFWLWLAPPTVVNRLDAAQVAEYLRLAIEALKLSKPK
jgi:hypothetical protein